MWKITPVAKQFGAIVCCNLLTLSFGFTSGWATINSVDLKNETSTFPTGPLTVDEMSLVISIDKFGGLIGNFGILPLMHFIGVKGTIHSLGFALVISSLFMIWAQNAYFLYVSRLLSGFTGGCLVVGIPSLINDISYANVRGALNSIYDPSNNVGLISSFFLANYWSSVDQAKMTLIMPVIFICLMFLFPESPEYLHSKNMEKKATKSRRFYKGIKVFDTDEMTQTTLERGHIEEVKPKYVDNNVETETKLELRDFLTPHSKRAFFISFIPLALSFISGSSVILNYVTDIFKQTGSSLDEKGSSLLIAIVPLIANIVMLNIVERFNRRTLYIWSSLLTAASFSLFGVYCLFWLNNPKFEWLPPLCFACIVFFSCLGLLPIPYIITTEVFPKKIRKPCLALALSCMWVILFVLDMILPQFLKHFDLFTLMFTLSLVCVANALFGIYCIVETRGKTFEEITQILSKSF